MFPQVNSCRILDAKSRHWEVEVDTFVKAWRSRCLLISATEISSVFCLFFVYLFLSFLGQLRDLINLHRGDEQGRKSPLKKMPLQKPDGLIQINLSI